MGVELMMQAKVCCDLLAPLFLEDPAKPGVRPLLETLAGADAEQLAGEWPLFAGDDEALGQAMVQLRSGAVAALTDPQGASRAFHHLFVGPRHLVAPPWGSVYTDHEKVVFGETCLELGLWLRRQGIDRLADQTEPPDHIGRMLALLGWMAEHRPELVGEYAAGHLLTWSHHYFERLEPVAREEGHDLYRAAAALADGMLLAFQEGLGLEVRYPRFFM
ncbi:MAG: molecular chaperone TorD family protein [Coriobacteriia bacterium]|nr:molecular chaperone TorD family protein [Coriobacteriia bacterium]